MLFSHRGWLNKCRLVRGTKRVGGALVALTSLSLKNRDMPARALMYAGNRSSILRSPTALFPPFSSPTVFLRNESH